MSTILIKDILTGEIGQFARFLHAYKECTPAIQSVVDEMTGIIADPESTDDDREHACDTIWEALFPALSTEIRESYHRLLNSPEMLEADRELDEEEAEFAGRVRAVMQRQNLTQEELAARAGVGQPAISNILNRRCRPQRRTIVKIAAALDVSPEELWPQFCEQ